MKLLVVDDHEIVRKGLKQIIADMPGAQSVDEASNGQEALDRVGKQDYDMVLMDISMPGRSGIDVVQELKARKPKLPVLILTMHPEEQYAMRALRAGASGYLTKESASEELITAIRKVSLGGRYVSSALAEKLAFRTHIGDQEPLHAALSNREFSVFCMLASGKPIKAISDELSLSAKTVSTYRARVLKKMNLSNNAELTHYAIKNNILE
jgi:two-component system invasion response regulator UvrY